MVIGLLTLVMTWTLAAVNGGTDDIDTLIALKSTVNSLQLSYESMFIKTDVLNRLIYFKATFEARTPFVPRGRVMFDTVVDNKGNGYNPSTGFFQAPRTGIYAFAVQSFTGSIYNASWDLNVNDRMTLRCRSLMAGKTSNEFVYPIKLQVGDQVTVYSRNDLYIYGERSSFFSGWLIRTF